MPSSPKSRPSWKEFKVVSTGDDVAAQIAAVNNFINSGYDAIVINAQNPAAFTPVIKRANEAGVVLVAFDNILDSDEAINVNVDQKGLGVIWADWLIQHLPERRQDPRGDGAWKARRSTATATTASTRRSTPPARTGRSSKWSASGTTDGAEGDRRRHRRPTDSSTASPRRAAPPAWCSAFMDAGHPFVPFGGETENGFRKFCGEHSGEGLECSSAGTGPAQVAVAIKTAIAALEGQVVPQSVRLPLAIVEHPDFKDGENYYSDQTDNFFVANAFPTCGINFTAQEIMGQTEADQ